MGPEAAVNAVYANKIAEIPEGSERDAFVAEKRAEYEKDIDLERLAADLVIDDIVEPEALRDTIIHRLSYAGGRSRHFTERHTGISPV